MNTGVLDESRGAVVVLGPDLQRPESLRRIGTPPGWRLLLDPPAGTGCGAGESSAARLPFRTWRLRPRVTLIVQDEMARLLDVQGGNIYALDLPGTRMLLAALEGGSEAMVRAVAEDYQAPEGQVRDDWVALLEEFHKAGLAEPLRLRPPGRGLPGLMSVWLGLTLAWTCFWLLGWERTLRLCRGFGPANIPPAPDDHDKVIAAVDGLVRRTASWHPLNPQCKERALVSWFLLRQMGLPARLLVGVALYPFEAHAWAECAGRVVGDDRARCEQFARVAAYE